MSLSNLKDSAKFLIDAEGNLQAVQLDPATWEEILSLIEDLEDAEELEQARQEEDEIIPWEEVKAKYLAAHPELGKDV